MQVESQVFFYEVNERPDFFWFKRLRVNTFQHVQHISASQQREMMPSLQFYVNPVRNRQDLAQRPQLRSSTQSRRNQVPDDLRIERIARNANSRVADNVARDSASSAHGRADVN